MRVAVVGCGFFSQYHLHSWNETPGVEIVAVCDVDRAKADAAARRFGVPAAYASVSDMLAKHRPDVVDIITTSASHRALVELAVEHASLVICQKPFADTYADAVAMVDAARRRGRVLLVHENFRWQRHYRALDERLKSGAIGTPRFARISFRHGVDNYDKQPYLAQIERFALMDMGLHLFDLARHLVGDVGAVTCLTQHYNPKVRGEDAFTVLVSHTGGAVSVLDCSYDSVIRPEPFPQTTAWIEGESGTLQLTADYGLIEHRREGLTRVELEPPVPAWGERPWHGIQDGVRAFVSHAVFVFRGEAEGQPTGEHNLQTLAAALACYDSAAGKKTIDLGHWIAGHR